jgi:histone acetyltransferase (RNA polymerase elongator complex component)
LPSDGEIIATIADWRFSSPGEPVEVAFFGGTFTSIPHEEQKRLLSVLQPLIRSGEVGSVRISTRPDALDREIIRFLQDCGVTTVELGVQSLDDRVLEQSGRGHTAADAVCACTLLNMAGMRFGIQLMPGLPSSTRESDMASLISAISLAPLFLRIYPAVVISGTELEQRYREGAYAPLSLADAVNLCGSMLLTAMRHKIPVIRMGLQPTDSLSCEGKVVAGPYHPAFRQLVESELCCEVIVRLVSGLERGTYATVRCAPSRVSDVIGQRRSNLSRISAAIGVVIDRVIPDTTLSKEEFIVETAAKELRGNLLHDIEGEFYA